MRRQVGQIIDVLALVGVVAAVMMLVRPGSHGPGMVRGLSEAFIASVGATVGAELQGPKAQPLPELPDSGGGGGGGPFGWLPDWLPIPGTGGGEDATRPVA